MFGVVLNVPIKLAVVPSTGGCSALTCTSAINLTFDSLATASLFDTTKIISCPTGSTLYNGDCSIIDVDTGILFYFTVKLSNISSFTISRRPSPKFFNFNSNGL